jgi:transposase-like protein
MCAGIHVAMVSRGARLRERLNKEIRRRTDVAGIFGDVCVV